MVRGGPQGLHAGRVADGPAEHGVEVDHMERICRKCGHQILSPAVAGLDPPQGSGDVRVIDGVFLQSLGHQLVQDRRGLQAHHLACGTCNKRSHRRIGGQAQGAVQEPHAGLQAAGLHQVVAAAPFQGTDAGHAHVGMVTQQPLFRHHLRPQMGGDEHGLQAFFCQESLHAAMARPGDQGKVQVPGPDAGLLQQGPSRVADGGDSINGHSVPPVYM